jgi:hypothetical protein
MAGQYGVEQLTKVVLFVADLANVTDKLLTGGGFISLFQLGPELISLANLDVAQFKKEVSELDADDKAKLVAAFKAKLALPDSKLEVKIETAVDLVVKVADTVSSLVSFVQSLKA